MLHMHRNARMEVEIDNFLLDKGTGQSLVDYENLKLDQGINMVFWLWRYFDATQHDRRFLFWDHLWEVQKDLKNYEYELYCMTHRIFHFMVPAFTIMKAQHPSS